MRRSDLDGKMKSHRIAVPQKVQLEVLSLSARRCALCFGIDGDFTEKAGQIAHLDQNRQNNDASNLAFLCLRHHDEFDSTRSQSKGYLMTEVVRYRSDLHSAVHARLRQAEITDSLAELLEAQALRLQEALDRFDSLSQSSDFLYAEVMLRIHALCEYAKMENKYSGTVESTADPDHWDFRAATTKLLGIPFWAHRILDGSVELDELVEESEMFFGLWVSGHGSPKACREFEDFVDDYLDLDLGWIICGVPYTELPSGGYYSLLAFFHKFGTRRYVD
jgi:hypothetical protein